MYFEFLSFYTVLLLYPTIFGIPAFIITTVTDRMSIIARISQIIYAAIIVFWTSFLYELWEKK